MCYSAQVWADYRKYVKWFGARLSIEAFTLGLNAANDAEFTDVIRR